MKTLRQALEAIAAAATPTPGLPWERYDKPNLAKLVDGIAIAAREALKLPYPKVRAVLSIYTSDGGMSAFNWTDTETGSEVLGTVSGPASNIQQAIYHYGGKSWDRSREVYEANHTHLGVREFSALTTGMGHAGCRGEEIWNYIKRKLDETH